jgi:hypothetical protein
LILWLFNDAISTACYILSVHELWTGKDKYKEGWGSSLLRRRSLTTIFQLKVLYRRKNW